MNDEHAHLIEHYARAGEHLALAIRGLTQEDILQPPPPSSDPNVGKWSIQQVVIHLADSELVMADRIKRLIAEEQPTLLSFNENRWVEHLAYEQQSAIDAATLVELSRKQLGKVLMTLNDEAMNRVGTHSEHGEMTLKKVIEMANTHLEHHLKFIHAKRAAMGKEMW